QTARPFPSVHAVQYSILRRTPAPIFLRNPLQAMAVAEALPPALAAPPRGCFGGRKFANTAARKIQPSTDSRAKPYNLRDLNRSTVFPNRKVRSESPNTSPDLARARAPLAPHR